MKPLVILEIANNHMGDLNHTKKLINTYHKLVKPFTTQIDFAIKFQHRDLKSYLHPNISNDDDRVKRFTSTELNEIQWNKIISIAKKNFKIICTPFNENSVDWVCRKKFDFLKIASCSFNDWPFLEKIKKKNIKLICSLGGGKINEISKTISFFSKKNIKYLYCVGMYPTKKENTNLAFFLKLKNTFGNIIQGFSSHEEPKESISGALAYGMGSLIFEKHINIYSPKYSINKYSSTPSDFLRWLTNLNHAIILTGNIKNREKNLTKEQNDIGKFKRGTYLKKNTEIKKGDIIKLSDVDFRFPAEKNQLLANEFSKFSTIKSNKNYKSLEAIKKNFCTIINSRSKIEKIRDKIHLLIKKSGIIIPKNIKLEISYHYGIENFEKKGLSMITILNNNYCKKYLFLTANQSHPTQFHKIKQESFFIILGKIELKIDGKKKILKKGDLFTIKQKQKHSFKDISGSGSVIEELSTKSLKSDSYYVDDLINRNKKRKSFISLYD